MQPKRKIMEILSHLHFQITRNYSQIISDELFRNVIYIYKKCIPLDFKNATKYGVGSEYCGIPLFLAPYKIYFLFFLNLTDFEDVPIYKKQVYY